MLGNSLRPAWFILHRPYRLDACTAATRRKWRDPEVTDDAWKTLGTLTVELVRPF
jgi:hypothetical protein